MTMDEQRDQRDEQPDEEIIDGEVVAEYSGTLLNLPEILGTQGQGDEDAESVDQARRRFVSRLLIGGAAALAVGGGAAVIAEQQRRAQTPQVVVLPNGAEVDQTDVSALYARIAELDAELAAVTAERDQLISAMSATDGDVQALQAELAAAQARIAELENINNLWQQLDDVGIDALLVGALGVLGGGLGNLLTLAGALRTGLNLGVQAVEAFLELLPGPRDGIRWLARQVTGLSDNLDWLAEQVQEAVDPVESFTALIADFVIWVLDRLPFGIGNRAQAGMEAMQAVINDLPALISGINDSVLDPLADWFSTDEDRNLTGLIVTPVQDNVFDPARDVLTKVDEFETTYKQELVDPVEEAIAEREAIRAQLETAQARLRQLA